MTGFDGFPALPADVKQVTHLQWGSPATQKLVMQ
jgi:hypothetical protein